MSTLSLQPPRVPLVDPATGMITREWYRFVTDTFNRIGGASAPTITDVVNSIDSNITIINETIADIGAAPSIIPFIPPDDDLAPKYEPRQIVEDFAPPIMPVAQQDDVSPSQLQFLIDSVEYMQTEVRSLAEQLALARTEIQELKQGTML